MDAFRELKMDQNPRRNMLGAEQKELEGRCLPHNRAWDLSWHHSIILPLLQQNTLVSLLIHLLHSDHTYSQSWNPMSSKKKDNNIYFLTYILLVFSSSFLPHPLPQLWSSFLAWPIEIVSHWSLCFCPLPFGSLISRSNQTDLGNILI